MKSKVSRFVLASALLAAAVVPATAGAAPVPAAVKTSISSVSISFNGEARNIRVIQSGDTTLYSIKDLAEGYGLKAEYSNNTVLVKGNNTVRVNVGKADYTVNGQTAQFSTNTQLVQDSLFIELTPFVKALGGTVLELNGATSIYTFPLLSGSFSHPQWINNDELIAAAEGDDSSALYQINPVTLASEKLSRNENSLQPVISPDGMYGAFVDSRAQLQLLQLNNGVNTPLGIDTTTKTDLVWSSDSKKIFFIQGDNQEKISSIDLVTRSITTILDDKVNFKSDLRVTPDNKTFLYTVNVTGTAVNDANSTLESLTIDFSKAGQQLYLLDSATKDAKPVQLTTANDNKLSPLLLPDGHAVYVSFNPDGDSVTGSLKLSAEAGKFTDLLSGLDVESTLLTASGQLIAIVSEGDLTTVYAVKENGVKTKLFSTSLDITELAPSPDGSRFAAIVDGKVIVFKNNTVTQVTE
ncbi:stalk domain-containing protein [Gorillibacterium massiliense]|uniref:stalk domain-containing protein n=1 Tax=Gorillibacterium massiliense TaxID=1280390 RepID=UPI0012DF1908|nr:stalk domain-containing protein [Gorillibacterium massiliense]